VIKLRGSVLANLEGAAGHALTLALLAEATQELAERDGLTADAVTRGALDARNSDALDRVEINGGATTVHRKVGTLRGR